MPAPIASEIELIVIPSLSSNKILGEKSGDLAKALAEVTAQALALFLGSTQVMPGIEHNATISPAFSGATVEAGVLTSAPASDLSPFADAVLRKYGIAGTGTPALAKVVARALEKGFELFIANVTVAAGIAILAGATAAPGMLVLMPALDRTALAQYVNSVMSAQEINGSAAPALANVLADTIVQTLGSFAQKVTVAPGIVCPPTTPLPLSSTPGILQ